MLENGVEEMYFVVVGIIYLAVVPYYIWIFYCRRELCGNSLKLRI